MGAARSARDPSDQYIVDVDSDGRVGRNAGRDATNHQFAVRRNRRYLDEIDTGHALQHVGEDFGAQVELRVGRDLRQRHGHVADQFFAPRGGAGHGLVLFRGFGCFGCGVGRCLPKSLAHGHRQHGE